MLASMKAPKQAGRLHECMIANKQESKQAKCKIPVTKKSRQQTRKLQLHLLQRKKETLHGNRKKSCNEAGRKEIILNDLKQVYKKGMKAR